MHCCQHSQQHYQLQLNNLVSLYFLSFCCCIALYCIAYCTQYCFPFYSILSIKIFLLAPTEALVASYDYRSGSSKTLFEIFTQPTPQVYNSCSKPTSETARLEPLEVPVEPRSAAVEHVAAPVEPVLAPVDKGSSGQWTKAPVLRGSRGLVFLQGACLFSQRRYHATTY